MPTLDSNTATMWDGNLVWRRREFGGRGPDRWYRPSEVAKALGVTADTVRRWIHTGELKATAIHANPAGGPGRPHWRIQGRDLTAFLEQGSV